jgi:hypothetical protein
MYIFEFLKVGWVYFMRKKGLRTSTHLFTLVLPVVLLIPGDDTKFSIISCINNTV